MDLLFPLKCIISKKETFPSGINHSFFFVKTKKNFGICSDDGVFRYIEDDFNPITREIKCHNDKILYAFLINDEYFVTCSRDKSMKLLRTYYFVPEPDESTKVIDHFKCEIYYKNQREGTHLETIEIYSWNNAHFETINQVISLSNSRMASCSDDKTIKIWNIQQPYEHIKTIECPDKVKEICKLHEKEILLSILGNKTMLIWNLTNNECIKKIDNVICSGPNCCVELPKYEQLIVGGGNSITAYNIEHLKFEIDFNFINKDLSDISTLMHIDEGYYVNSDHFFIGTDKGSLFLFNIKTQKLKWIEKLHHGKINCINYSFPKYYSVSSDCDRVQFTFEKEKE